MSLMKVRPFGMIFARMAGTGAQTPTPPKQSMSPKSSSDGKDPSQYNTPEYFQHEKYSFYDISTSMFKHRIGQPSKYDPLVPKK